MPTVLVTDAERGSAVAVIRSLGRAGHGVVAAASSRIVPGFRSRYTRHRIRHPSAMVDPDAVVRVLVAAVRRHAVDLVIPVTDEILLPLSQQRERFPPSCHLAIPSPAALESVTDKLETVELARSVDVPIPTTAAVESVEDAQAAAAQIGWPVVVKPRRSLSFTEGSALRRRWVRYARDEGQLRVLLDDTEGPGFLIQALTPGVGRGLSVVARDGKLLAAFQHRRLREVPLTGGASSFRESEPVDPQLLEYAARLLGANDWTGLAMVEFKTTSHGPVLMEINGRVWGSLPLAVASGMDFPKRLADLYLSSSAPASDAVDTEYELGVRSRDMELELSWAYDVLRRRRTPFGEYPPRRRAVGVALRLLSPRDGYDILSRRDVRPGLTLLGKVVTKPVRAGLGRLVRRRPR